MNGLFTRLVREATGQPRNPVKAVLPVRFQQDMQTAPAAAVAAPFEAVAGRGAGSPAATIEALPPALIPAAAELRGNTGSSDDTARPLRQAPVEPRGGKSDAAPPGVPDSARKPQATQPTGDTGVIASEALATSVDVAASADPGFHQDKPIQRAGDLPTAIEPSAPDAGQAPAPVEPGVPQPLLAVLAQVTPVTAQNASQSPGMATDAPGEVHVHIGRIEVTALPSTAAPKPKPRNARQPMSLDDYLVRRGPGRS